MEKSTDFSISQLVLKAVGISTFLTTLVYGSAGWGFVLLFLGFIAVFEYLFNFRKSSLFNPYSLMIFSPLLLLYYSSITDFRIRAFTFILLVYLFNTAYKKTGLAFTFSLLKAKPWTTWLTAFIIFALAAAALSKHDVQLSGDEPHYLMITQSLVDDGDFDLKNNMVEKTYYDYIPVDLRFHGKDYNGKYRSIHFPGLSFLLIPFYWLFQVLGIGKILPPALYFRLAAAVINAFFALALFYVLKRKFPDKDVTGFWLLFLCLFPLVFYGIHLYPELPASGLMISAYLFAFSEKKNYLLAGLFLAFIPWFHVKYLPPLAVLYAAILYHLLIPASHTSRLDTPDTGKTKFFEKTKIKSLAQLMVFPVLGAILLLIYCKTLYGTFNPAEVMPKENYWGVPWLLRWKVFLANFLDQRDGLLFYAPVFFLFFFGFKKKLEHKYLLLGLAAVHVLFHAFLTTRGGHAPSGRPLVFILWILILFIAHFYYNTCSQSNDFRYHFTFRVMAGLSVFVLVWLFYYPLFVYQPVFAQTIERPSSLNLFLGSDVIPLCRFFPSFLTHPPSPHPANHVWVVLLVIALLIYYIKPLKPVKKPFLTQPTAFVPFILFLGLGFLYCFYPHVRLPIHNKYSDRVIGFYNSSRNFIYVPDQGKFSIKAGNTYDIYIDQKFKRKNEVTLHFTSTDTVDVTIHNGKRLLFEAKSIGKNEISFPLQLSSLATFKVRGKLVSHLGIDTHTRQEDSFLWLAIDLP